MSTDATVLIVGSVAFDTLHMPSGSFAKVLGGSATFASLAASFFCRPRLVGVVGKDYPKSAIDMLTSRGVDLAGLEVAEGDTFHWEGRYSDDLTGRTTLCTDLNVFATFHPKIPSQFRDTPFVLLGNIDPALQIEVLDQLDRPKLVVADTMNFWIRGTRAKLLELLRRIDVLVINEEEARELAGLRNIVQVARSLVSMGPQTIVIKQGEYGALLFERDEKSPGSLSIFSAPAYPVDEVIDPTGAGDTFVGAMLGFLAQRGRVDSAALRQGVIYGSTVASYCVEGIGVRRLCEITRAQIDDRFHTFHKLAHFEG